MLVTDWLDRWAAETPDAIFLAERQAGADWATIAYAEFRTQARRVAQGLLERGLGAGHQIAILSGNSREHALVAMGALYAGVPYVPLSPAYSLVSKDYAKLRWLLERIQPSIVFAEDRDAFVPALRSAAPSSSEIVHSAAVLMAEGFRPAQATPASTAKILFTSGSTGNPKGVINTHRMLTSNQASLSAALGRTASSPPPVLCDWLPWHHTFGGNHNFGFVLSNGGTLHIDAGRPTADGVQQSLRNLAEVAPTAYFNVPLGFEMLLHHLRRDPGFRERFFSRLDLLYSAAASLPAGIQEELLQMAPPSVTFAGGFGATETAPLSLFKTGSSPHARFIGRPVPGVEVKLAPAGAKYELCVRGPSVMPGYWKEEWTARFDEEGYFRTGDAVRFADPGNPGEGFCYEGRLSEDFKLSSGTWIDAGALRERVLSACGPLIRDCVIVGEDRAFLGALLFADEVTSNDPAHQVQLGGILDDLAKQGTGSSNRIVVAVVLTPPTAGEITEKGSLNRGEILRNRADALADLFHPNPSSRVIRVCL